jgi:hypothetical protein
MSEANFQRVENTHVIRVNKSVDDLWSTNYVMFQNADYNNKWFYGFVEEIEYVQRNTTKVHFKLDVFQTWFHDVDFKPSFVEREHCKLWNEDGTPVINTVDEGLDFGQEYDNVYSQKVTVDDDWKWLVIVCKTPLESQASNQVHGSVVGYPQPLSYYVVPFSLTGEQPIVEIDTGFSQPVGSVIDVLEDLYSMEDAVNNVVSIYVTEFTGLEYTSTQPSGSSKYFSFLNRRGQNVQGTLIGDNYLIRIDSVREFSDTFKTVLTNKYEHYRDVKESKLLMFPYAYTVLNDFKGGHAIIKNEYTNTNFLQLTVKGSIGTSNKVSWTIEDYNQSWGFNRLNTSDEFGIIDKQPNDVPIITDMLSAYLQGNRNSIQTQISNTGRSMIMNTIGNGIGVASGLAMHQYSMAGAYTSNIIQGATDGLNNIYSIMAKVNDVKNVPPQIENMGGNNSYELGNRFDGVYVIQKQIKPEYIRKLETFFGMFGYRVNEVKTPNFHTRRHFNFVKTQNATVLGNVNNDVINELQRIFDNGITLWHTDDVGNYSLDNEVI